MFCSYLGHSNNVTFVGETSKRRPKSEGFVLIRLSGIGGPITTWEGGEGGREVLNEEARVAASCQKIK